MTAGQIIAAALLAGGMTAGGLAVAARRVRLDPLDAQIIVMVSVILAAVIALTLASAGIR